MATALQQAYRHCAAVTRARAKNFYYAFLPLPPARRRAIYAVYAFSRCCDDIADGSLPPEDKVRQLLDLADDLDDAYHGHTKGPVFEALWDAAQRYAIPQKYFLELIRGVEMDLRVRRYQTFEELYEYCYRVASVVGLTCIQIFGYRDPRAKEYAVDLGIAMQLTNIIRDVPEDRGHDRVYIPQDELARFGVTERHLLEGIVDEPFQSLLAFQVERARDYFRRGHRLLPLLPRLSRPCPAILEALYCRVLDRVEAQGYNVFQGRISLPAYRKLALMGTVWAQTLVLGEPRLPA
ncbi:MAG: presqualene diphosphate synthase HpnD [Chloroflexi bacterium]|nr:presqualene diphosphate synthase HpnD [Chloroflexota bacterium]